jgi:hypothetical protein
VLCQLSPSGEQAVNHIWQTARTRCCELLKTMDVGKLRMLSEALGAMMSAAIVESHPAGGLQD